MRYHLSTRTTLSILAAITVAGAGLAAASPASAATPSATLTPLDRKIDANSRPSFQYTLAHLPRGVDKHLQRQFGTAHVWKNVATIIGTSGTVTAPAVPLGRYVYRIHVSKNGALVVNSTKHAILSYGNISIRTLCGPMTSLDSYCTTGTEEVGTTVFAYAMDLNANMYPDWGDGMHMNRTSCRSVSLRYASDDPDYQYSYLRITQSASDPQRDHNSVSHIGQMKAHLDGGPFYLDAANVNTDTGSRWNSYDVYVNGNASCYTANGRR